MQDDDDNRSNRKAGGEALQSLLDANPELLEQLIYSERLATMGILTAALAHELNNVNAAITGYTDLALLRRDMDPKIQNYFNKISNAATRGRDLVGDMLNFRCVEDRVAEKADLARIVEVAVNLVAKEYKRSGIDLVTELTSDGQVSMVQSQIIQVLVTLLLHARNSLVKCNVDMPRVVVSAAAGVVHVSDNGPSLSAGDDPFNLFFCRGHGFVRDPKHPHPALGLCLARSIVNRHNGTILLENLPDQGVVAIITLPMD